MFRHISKLTASKLKFSSVNDRDTAYTNPRMIESWIKETQIGFDALLNDQFILAEDIFLDKQDQFDCKTSKSPFHAFGYAFLTYTKAMLALERKEIEKTAECISKVEGFLKQKLNKNKTRNSMIKIAMNKGNLPTSCSMPSDITELVQDRLRHHLELLQANVVLMSATLQFLLNKWTDTIKAGYDLYRSFRIYEHLFESMVGVKLSEYETSISLNQQKVATFRHSDGLLSDTLCYGAFFGIGLFHLFFSLLPTKVAKILNNLGFQPSRTIAVHLLNQSCKNETMYASLSSLVLLTFYTNVSAYIQPQINRFFSFQDATCALEFLKHKHPNGRIWQLIEGQLKTQTNCLDQSLMLFNQAKRPVGDQVIPSLMYDQETTPIRSQSVIEFNQFRVFVIYEIGWVHIYTGDYAKATETFFWLESMCNWSRLFYHYISTCCMIADGLYDKAILEIKQIRELFQQKRKTSSRLSSHEHYAESKVQSWLDVSESQAISLRETLEHHIINPVWELVYLWNGTRHLQHKVLVDIKRRFQTCHPKDPVLCLVMGVIYRDIHQDIELAMECLNLALLVEAHWTFPYAMYEIAVTYCTQQQKRSDIQIIVSDWIQCIERHYQQHSQDTEWEARMQIKCQLLLESYCLEKSI
ncbi:Tetratricopeptide repeat protein 39C [Choanephora cucurbitarum]|uniref:Tetratricopeptide repeat protein 39C n=1 Tax=Choanephora cucurbitarum TaxID=101091 RepID=A0A1C7N0I9_9FUNG|nr:Tetratricopeptide repeat protein 39C [Choanephora cucurbitarum]